MSSQFIRNKSCDQRKTIHEDVSSPFRGNKPCQDDVHYVTQEMFSDMNTWHIKRYSAMEKV